MIVIADRILHKTQPGEPIEVLPGPGSPCTPEQAAVLVQLGYAHWPDSEGERSARRDQPDTLVKPHAPRRRTYRRRDLTAE